MLAILIDPETVPAVVGANTTSRVALWFGDRIKPAFTPESLNPAPVTLTAAMVTLVFPVFFMATLCELLASTAIFPNARLDGLTLRVAVAAAAVPVRASAVGEFGALLDREIEPVTFPAEVGPNAILNDAVLPGWTVSGVVKPVTLNPLPVTAYEATVSAAFPELEIVTGCELL